MQIWGAILFKGTPPVSLLSGKKFLHFVNAIITKAVKIDGQKIHGTT